MPQAPLTILLALLSVVVPLTLEPNTAVLVILWTLTGLSFLWTVASIPAVSSLFWGAVTERVGERAPKAEETTGEPKAHERLRMVRNIQEQLRDAIRDIRKAVRDDDPNSLVEYDPSFQWRMYKNDMAGDPELQGLYEALSRFFGDFPEELGSWIEVEYHGAPMGEYYTETTWTKGGQEAAKEFTGRIAYLNTYLQRVVNHYRRDE